MSGASRGLVSLVNVIRCLSFPLENAGCPRIPKTLTRANQHLSTTLQERHPSLETPWCLLSQSLKERKAENSYLLTHQEQPIVAQYMYHEVSDRVHRGSAEHVCDQPKTVILYMVIHRIKAASGRLSISQISIYYWILVNFSPSLNEEWLAHWSM